MSAVATELLVHVRIAPRLALVRPRGSFRNGAAYGSVGRPRRSPDCVSADRGHDHDKYRWRFCASGRFKPVIDRRTTELAPAGPHREVVEQGFRRLHQFRRLLVRCERRA
jgi:hypothetical protein